MYAIIFITVSDIQQGTFPQTMLVPVDPYLFRKYYVHDSCEQGV